MTRKAITQVKLSSKAYSLGLLGFILFVSLLLNVSDRFISAINVVLNHSESYFLTKQQTYIYLFIYSAVIISVIILPSYYRKEEWITISLKACLLGGVVSIIGGFYSDMFYLFEISKVTGIYENFPEKIQLYITQEAWFYIYLGLLILVVVIIRHRLYKTKIQSSFSPITISYYGVAALLIPLIIVYPLPVMNIHLLSISSATEFIELPLLLVFSQNLIYSIANIILLISAYGYRKKHGLKFNSLIKLSNLVGIVAILTLCFQGYLSIIPYKILSEQVWFSPWQILSDSSADIKENAIKFIPLLILIAFTGVFRQVIKKKQFNDLGSDETTGNFGTASWATSKDIERMNGYDKENKIPIGIDSMGKPLYFPLCNKLIISPQGGGKSTTSSIPVLLSYEGPIFAFDTKGELWAVTARYRSEVLKRKVVVIDPYKVSRGKDFVRGKPDELLIDYKINPFDWIPEERLLRDRMLNEFAASFIINEGGYSTHFDDNAKILIRGYIDYMMSLEPAQRNLPMLYYLMSERVEEAELTFQQMSQQGGRAGAAANQLMRVGIDERGSILSTSYRQIDWMGDSNIQEIVSESNFDLRDFVKGNMDIFIILPEDQVKEHSRLFRMIMSLLMGIIVQTDPSKLPKKQMLFLLEELAQLGYTPDVEKCIEVLRARRVVIWTVFQTLSQIKMFEKPDLFKGAPLKQIFTNDDTETMEWIQTLGGKKTVLTKTMSTSKGDSWQKMQTFGGSVSKGEGESIHETGTDLIQLNEIREMPKDEQLIFLHSSKPIYCKKLRYFENPEFVNKFDENPLEKI